MQKRYIISSWFIYILIFLNTILISTFSFPIELLTILVYMRFCSYGIHESDIKEKQIIFISSVYKLIIWMLYASRLPSTYIDITLVSLSNCIFFIIDLCISKYLFRYISKDLVITVFGLQNHKMPKIIMFLYVLFSSVMLILLYNDINFWLIEFCIIGYVLVIYVFVKKMTVHLPKTFTYVFYIWLCSKMLQGHEFYNITLTLPIYISYILGMYLIHVYLFKNVNNKNIK